VQAIQDVAIDFQKKLALISTIDDSGQSLSQLGDTVRRLSDEFNIPILEVAAGLYQTISNQVGDAAQSTRFYADRGQSVSVVCISSFGVGRNRRRRISSIVALRIARLR